MSDGAAFAHAAGIVRRCKAPLAIVCSAPAGVTDLLLEVAEQARLANPARVQTALASLRAKYRDIMTALRLSAGVRRNLAAIVDASMDELQALSTGLMVLRELTPRTSDLVVSRGERLGARIFCAALRAAKVRAEYVDAVDIIATDGPFGGAHPNLSETDKNVRVTLRPLMARGIVPVVPGFLGALREDGPETCVATLGRGGSDLTATLLGRALGAARVTLWKDVPGLLTADPRVVPDTRVIPQLNLREAAELAYAGAKVLHSRALIPVGDRNIPVFVRPFAKPDAPGTEISTRHTLDRYPVKALSAVGGQALLTVAGRGLLGVSGVAARTFSTLSARGISVSIITQSSSEQSICFTVPEQQARAAKDSLERAFKDEIARGEVDGIEVRPGMAIVAVVGLGMAGTPGIAARVFSALAAAGINLVAIAQGSSELNISFVVTAAQSSDAQRRIHDAFKLAKIGGGAVTEKKAVDIVLFGFGQIGRTLGGLLQRRKNGVLLRIVAVVDRSGFVFDPQGLAQSHVTQLAACKQAGRPLARVRGGKSSAPVDTITFLARHALSNPVLVDLTADDTTSVLLLALQAGMDVVMANKRPLSAKKADTDRLFAVALAHGRRLRFEATVGAGLPILGTYRKLVESHDRVLKIQGCVSGTLGFLLTEVGKGRPFSESLLAAVAKGYTEPDPRDDLSGADVGRKALILGRLLGFQGEPEDIEVESLVPRAAASLSRDEFVASLARWDGDWEKRVADARARGGALRYVATVTKQKIRVGLQICDPGSPFAALRGSDNQIAFTTTRYKSPLVIRGAGAGPDVTAGGVLNDILELAG